MKKLTDLLDVLRIEERSETFDGMSVLWAKESDSEQERLLFGHEDPKVLYKARKQIEELMKSAFEAGVENNEEFKDVVDTMCWAMNQLRSIHEAGFCFQWRVEHVDVWKKYR